MAEPSRYNRFFRKFFTEFSDYDEMRVKNDLEIVVDEEVSLNDFKSNNATLSFTCENQDNILFSTECLREDFASSTVIRRKLTLKKVDIDHEHLQSLMPEIRKLNQVSESQVVY